MVATRASCVALAGSAVFALNPNVLYLQSTPMTEPLLLATTTVAVAMLMRWTDDTRLTQRVTGNQVGWAFALACLTRYEAWPVTVCALACAVWARWRRDQPLAAAVRDVGAIALYPAIAIVGFAVFSRVVVGRWFVSSDFFVPENKAIGDPLLAAAEIGWGARMLSGWLLVALGGAGAAVLLGMGMISRRRADR